MVTPGNEESRSQLVFVFFDQAIGVELSRVFRFTDVWAWFRSLKTFIVRQSF